MAIPRERLDPSSMVTDSSRTAPPSAAKKFSKSWKKFFKARKNFFVQGKIFFLARPGRRRAIAGAYTHTHTQTHTHKKVFLNFILKREFFLFLAH